jgi:hypothetical protein
MKNSRKGTSRLGTSPFRGISPATLKKIVGEIDSEGILNIVSKLHLIIKEIRTMSKVVGELKSIKIGNGKTDLVVGETKIGAWHTIKTKTGAEIPNPALSQLEGCKVGDTVEAEVFVTKSGYTNLNGISIQTSPGHVPATSTGEPSGVPVVIPFPAGDFERFYCAVAPAVYNALGRIIGKQDSSVWVEENHERFSAVANAVIEHAYDHFVGLKHTLGQ